MFSQLIIRARDILIAFCVATLVVSCAGGPVEKGALGGAAIGGVIGGIAEGDAGGVATGAAIGAISGAILGKVAEGNARKYEPPPQPAP